MISDLLGPSSVPMHCGAHHPPPPFPVADALDAPPPNKGGEYWFLSAL